MTNYVGDGLSDRTVYQAAGARRLERRVATTGGAAGSRTLASADCKAAALLFPNALLDGGCGVSAAALTSEGAVALADLDLGYPFVNGGSVSASVSTEGAFVLTGLGLGRPCVGASARVAFAFLPFRPAAADAGSVARIGAVA